MRLPMMAQARADRGVAIQGAGEQKRLCLCQEGLKCGSLPEEHSPGRRRPAEGAQFVSLVSIDATGSEWSGGD